MPSQQIYTYHPSSLGEDRRRRWKKGRQRIKIGNEDQQKCHEMAALRASEPRRRSRNVMKWWHYHYCTLLPQTTKKTKTTTVYVRFSTYHVRRRIPLLFSHVKKIVWKNIFEKNIYPLTKIRPTQMSGVSALYGSNQPYPFWKCWWCSDDDPLGISEILGWQ